MWGRVARRIVIGSEWWPTRQLLLQPHCTAGVDRMVISGWAVMRPEREASRLAFQLADCRASPPRVQMSLMIGEAIRLDILVEPQQVRGVVLFLDLDQASIVRPVGRAHKLLAGVA
jgi:hypothetical protein